MSNDQNNPEEIFQEELQDLHSAVKDAIKKYKIDQSKPMPTKL